MADLDREEYTRLQGVIADLEKHLNASPQRVNPLLSAWLENCRKQLEVLEKKIKEKEQEARTQQDLTIQAAVDRETALNKDEKQAYGGFLKEAFFTKADFGRLETFYANSYDKLSESGKENMHHRIWEGIRGNEFEFSDLPKNVQKKDISMVQKDLLGGKDNISKKDRADFLSACAQGKQDDACEILKRQCFKENISTQGNQVVREPIIDKAGSTKGAANSEMSKGTSSTAAKNNIDVSSVDLSKLNLAETDIAVKPNVPGSNSQAVKSL